MNTTIKRRFIVTGSWLLAAACMALIFYFSSRPGDDSTAQSDLFLRFFQEVLHLDINGIIVRKLAHTAEFAGLGLLMGNALYQTSRRPRLLLAFLLSSTYAATDEIHQLFVPGRACSAIDWAIDSFGVLLGVGCFAFALCLVKHRSTERRGTK